MKEAAERAGVRAGGPAARRHRGARAGAGEARRRARATPPTPTSSPSPRTSSRPPSRSSTSAAAGSAASAAGWSRRSRTTTTAELVEHLLQQVYGERVRRRACPREVLVPVLPDDADVLAQLARRRCAAAGSTCACRSAATRGRCWRRSQRNAEQSLALHKIAAGRRPDHPQPGAGGDRRRRSTWTRRRCGSSATTSRHLQGTERRRLDGGLRGRPAAQERVPPVHVARRRAGHAHRRHRGDARGDHPPVPALPRGREREHELGTAREPRRRPTPPTPAAGCR